MAEILLFHHAQGFTAGVQAFADDVRAAGHVVHAHDLYDGATFGTVDEGVAHARSLGFAVLQERGEQLAQDLPADLVYVGFSMGCMPAQKLAMTRPGARGALLLHSAIPLSEFGGTWPDGLRGQIHVMEDDDWGDVPDARELVAAAPEVELFLYPGSAHLFSDRSLAEHDEAAATLLRQRVLVFLAELDAGRADSSGTTRP
ncbi:MAG: dienelactone hydrolase [Frankiales bacterium]|jgi:dienelactone hydrolase|nr:dienelactone hydrolase [Frankiales bacterium]